MEDKIARIKELNQILTKASESYYAKDEEIMSNFEYDAEEAYNKAKAEDNTATEMITVPVWLKK